jgi:hypothetical protein
MESKGSVTQVGVVLECAVGMAWSNGCDGTQGVPGRGHVCSFPTFYLVTKTVMVRTWRVPSLAIPILLRAWTAPEEDLGPQWRRTTC